VRRRNHSSTFAHSAVVKGCAGGTFHFFHSIPAKRSRFTKSTSMALFSNARRVPVMMFATVFSESGRPLRPRRCRKRACNNATSVGRMVPSGISAISSGRM
jgi:hypothetical protein